VGVAVEVIYQTNVIIPPPGGHRQGADRAGRHPAHSVRHGRLRRAGRECL